MNPPYGAVMSRWLEKLSVHGDGVALIFARTETAMFQDFVWRRSHGIRFLRGRISFCDRKGKPAGPAGAPSCLIAYGEANADALASCDIPGYFVRLRPEVRERNYGLFGEAA